MIAAINSTSQWPNGYVNPALLGTLTSENLIDGNEQTQIHTKTCGGGMCWWKAVFKTTVYITSFTIVARYDCCQERLDDVVISAVIYDSPSLEKGKNHEKVCFFGGVFG